MVRTMTCSMRMRSANIEFSVLFYTEGAKHGRTAIIACMPQGEGAARKEIHARDSAPLMYRPPSTNRTIWTYKQMLR